MEMAHGFCGLAVNGDGGMIEHLCRDGGHPLVGALDFANQIIEIGPCQGIQMDTGDPWLSFEFLVDKDPLLEIELFLRQRQRGVNVKHIVGFAGSRTGIAFRLVGVEIFLDNRAKCV